MHILRDMLPSGSMSTLRDRHTRASNKEYARHILGDRSIGAPSPQIITSRFKVNVYV